MRHTLKILLTGILLAHWATLGTQAANYQLDNNSISIPLNASDGTEPNDNWFGNVFTAQVGANLITNVDFGLFTTTPGSSASVVLYRVTDPGGNPALGATRVYTQAFTPLTGDNTNAFLQSIPLTSPVAFNPGDRFLVAVFIKNVIGAPPNDVYPYLLDTSGVAAGTYWDRSAPNTFNLDNLSQAKPINQPLTPGGFTPGPGHIFIRASGGPSAPGPCLQVVKQCAYPTNSPTCFAAGSPIDFTGYVTNCGDIALFNVILADSRTLLGLGLTDLNGSPLPQPLSLTPHQVVAFKGSFLPTSAETCAGSAANTITATVLGPADAVHTDGAVGTLTNSTTATCAICVNPCLAVTGVCSTNLVVNCGTNSSSIGFSGIVSNCGNITLTNVALTDDLTGGVVLALGSLAVGATAPWSAILPVTAALCGRSNIVNTVTAVGANLCNPAQVVTNRANCSFTVACLNPGITVTKACASPIVTNVGSSLTVTGQVCNTGTITFDNVVVVDGQPGLPTAATNNIGTLAPGQCKPYSFTYTATTCDPNHDTVTATGTSACGIATATASADCFLCCPGISIQTLVGCLQAGATCPPSSSSYSTQVTGVLGNLGDPVVDNPAFCYIVVVRNTGHDPLTNIVIHDDHLGALGTFPGPLAIGGTITISNLRTNWAATTTNTTMVTAQCGGVHANGASVGAATNAVAVVLSGASVTCAMSISSPDDLDGNPNDAHVSISGSGNHNVTFTIIVTAGSLPLANVTLASPTLASFGCALPPAFSMPAHSNFTYVCSASINCTNIPGGVLTNVAVITAQLGASPGVCAYNLAGTPVLVTSTTGGPPCAVVLDCKSQPKICVSKDVVCELPNGCADNWSSLAVGAKAADNSQCPSFCYRFRVTNCGGEDLRNVTVLDDVLDLSACNFPTAMAVGQTVECIYAGVLHCDSVTNTVTAGGVSVTSGSNVTASATAAVEVHSIAITCNATVNGQTNITIRCDGQPHPVTNAIEICNTGELPLAVTAINGHNGAPLGGDCTNLANLQFSLLPGECTNVACVETLTCEPSSEVCEFVHQIDITVLATVDAAQTNACSYTRNQSNQVVAVTASSSCSATVILDADGTPPQVECRAGVNPSGKKIPVAGKNPASGQNPDGYYQLLAKDNCDPDPAIYLGDTGSTFVAGPFHSGDIIKLTQSPGKTPSQDPAPAPIVAHVHLKGDGRLFAVDAAGNVSEVQTCLVPRPPK